MSDFETADAVETTDTSLTIRRTFDASRDRVFRAFTDSDDLEAWQSIGDLAVEVHTIEPEPGGSLSVTHSPGKEADHDRFDFEGTFLEVVENERLVYTLRSVGGPYAGMESRFTVEFRDADDGTEVVFTQTEVDPAMVDGTAATWNEMLEHLEGILAAP